DLLPVDRRPHVRRRLLLLLATRPAEKNQRPQRQQRRRPRQSRRKEAHVRARVGAGFSPSQPRRGSFYKRGRTQGPVLRQLSSRGPREYTPRKPAFAFSRRSPTRARGANSDSTAAGACCSRG